MNRRGVLTSVLCAATLLAFTACSEGVTVESVLSDNSHAQGSSSDVHSANGDTSHGGAENESGASDTGESGLQSGAPVDVKADCDILFSDASAEISGNGASADGTCVTVNAAGTYSVSGSCTDGRIIVDADGDDKVTLILNNASVTSGNSSVIYCKNAKELTIQLADGTQNTLGDSENYTFEDGGDEPDAAVFSADDLVILGNGKLTVNAVYKDGIKSKDTLDINSGTIDVNSADDGIIGKDYLVITGGTLNVNAVGDGIKSTEADDSELGYVTVSGGTVNITSGNDAVQAQTAVTVKDGVVNAVAGGGSATVEHSSGDGFGMGFHDKFSGGGNNPFDFDDMTSSDGSTSQSMKGLKAETTVTVKGGTINIDSADDAIHSSEVILSGGAITVSSGDDGIHSDGSLLFSGADVTVSNSYEGLEGLNIEITSGTVSVTASDDGMNAAGGDNGQMMGFNPSNSDQYYIRISGGDITVNAGGDGIDSNGTVEQSGGSLIVYGPTNSGNGALDYEKAYSLTGGTVIAMGASGMALTPTSSTFPCIGINTSVSADSTIEVKDTEGNTVLTANSPKSAQSLIIGSDKLVEGKEYTVYVNDSSVSTFTAENGVSASAGGMFAGNGGGGRHPGGMMR